MTMTTDDTHIRPGDRIRVHRTGAFGLPVTFTATVLENRGHLGFRLQQDDTGKKWVMAPTGTIRKHGDEQTIEVLEEAR